MTDWFLKYKLLKMPKSFLLKRKFKEENIDVVGDYDSDGESWRTGKAVITL